MVGFSFQPRCLVTMFGPVLWGQDDRILTVTTPGRSYSGQTLIKCTCMQSSGLTFARKKVVKREIIISYFFTFV